MKKLYLVRHGQTLFNELHMTQGWCDSPLTELGKKQAKEAGRSLRNVDFSAVYTSTSERTSDTAKFISDFMKGSASSRSLKIGSLTTPMRLFRTEASRFRKWLKDLKIALRQS